MHFRKILPALCCSLVAACSGNSDGGPSTSLQPLESATAKDHDQGELSRGNSNQLEPGQRGLHPRTRCKAEHRKDGDECAELNVKRVLLLSIDGMHQRDLKRFIAANPESNLAKLAQHGVQYTNAWVNSLDGSPTNPTDSFPGLLALTTGGSSPTHGGWYDVSWVRDLYPAGCTGKPGILAQYSEFADADATLSSLWGSVTDNHPTHDPVVVRSRLDPSRLPHKKAGAACTPVYPHQFIRTNSIFEVAKAAGLRTAWSDKHLTYELVSGPSGLGLDDFFAPEINSSATSLIPGAVGDFTKKTEYTKVYDDFKVKAILNEIDGRWSDDGLVGAADVHGRPGVPNLFGMNFQAVSVAQKDAKVGPGGYTDAQGTPSPELADALEHTDDSIGKMVAELKAKGLFASTMIIVTAKHGQSPIDHSLLHREDGDAIAAHVDAAAPLDGFASDAGNGHIEDDVGLYWLSNPSTATAAAGALSAPFTTGAGVVDPRAEKIFTVNSPGFVGMFGDPRTDPHTPDVIVQVEKGTMYSLSTKKWAEHGGFADDDSNVALLVSHPALEADTVSSKVRTKQVAPTILQALELDPQSLDAVRIEHTAVLPDLIAREDEVDFEAAGGGGSGGAGSVGGSGGSGSPGVTAVGPYTISTWASAPTGATSLDAIESDGTHLWAAYQNKTTKDGSNGGPGFVTDSTIIEYTLESAFQLNSFSFGGHVDGLRVDPQTKLVWITSNEDGGARLFRLDARTGISTEITVGALPQGGGLDDLAFLDGKMFAVASAPSKDPNTDPALLQVIITGDTATFVPALFGNEAATDYNTGAPTTLNLQDPDSLAITSDGQLVLSNQDGQQLVFVKNPGAASHTVRVLNVADKIDDSAWATSQRGRLLVADGNTNVIYSVKKRGGFAPGEAFTQVDHHAVTAPLVGTLNLTSGTFTTIASGPGLANPTGMVFLPSR